MGQVSRGNLVSLFISTLEQLCIAGLWMSWPQLAFYLKANGYYTGKMFTSFIQTEFELQPTFKMIKVPKETLTQNPSTKRFDFSTILITKKLNS